MPQGSVNWEDQSKSYGKVTVSLRFRWHLKDLVWVNDVLRKSASGECFNKGNVWILRHIHTRVHQMRSGQTVFQFHSCSLAFLSLCGSFWIWTHRWDLKALNFLFNQSFWMLLSQGQRSSPTESRLTLSTRLSHLMENAQCLEHLQVWDGHSYKYIHSDKKHKHS